ncbi:MAG: hypothetical protein CMF59_02270 [Leptospiraceae bacterium]|nr:hypothetical protein [Leptospiraceae bacterium]
MSQVVQSIIIFLWKTPVAFLKGWWQVGKKSIHSLLEFCKSLGTGWLLLMASLAVIAVAGWPWFSYEIQFEQLEVYGVRSRFWTFFTSAGFLGLIVSLVQFPHRRTIFWVLSAVALLAWIAGLIWTSTVHVTFHQDTSFQTLIPFWIYPGLLATSVLASLLLPREAGWDVTSAYHNLNRHPE